MLKHWTVVLFQDSLAHMHVVVRADAENISVVSRMMDLAERQSVLDDRSPAIIRIWNDVGRIEKLRVRQAADGASVAIGGDDKIPKGALMQALAGLRPDVSAQVQRRKGD